MRGAGTHRAREGQDSARVRVMLQPVSQTVEEGLGIKRGWGVSHTFIKEDE